MLKLVRTLSLLAAFSAIATMPVVGTAQEKKKETPKKETTKPAGGYVEVKETAKGTFYFSIRNADGKFLAGGSPSGVAKKEDVAKMIEEIKAALATGKITEAKTEEKAK